VEPFGAFVSLEPGIEALLHVSQISDDKTVDPRRELYEAQRVLTRVISIESDKQRLGLSLKEVTVSEKDTWQQAKADAAEAAATTAATATEAAAQ
jgi:ribosomal protein S1